MEGLEDYCLHKHPLIYNDDQQVDWCCSACGLPLLLSPSYRCSNYTCNFFLHKACKQLPQGLNYDVEMVNLALSLAVKPPYQEWTCDVCGELCRNLIAYRGTQWYEFEGRKFEERIVYFDVLCAPVTLEIKSKHDSHKHELVAMRREALLLCDVCERPHKGFFFSCKEHSCVFWIHKDCAVLPRIIETTFHVHPLVFSYSQLDKFFQRFITESHQCLICGEKLSGSAAYCCTVCPELFVHFNCAISKIINSEYDPPVQFPLEEAEKSLFIYKMLDKKRIVEKNNDEDEKSSIQKYHNHPLIFHDIVDKDSSSNSLCDACIQPVTSTTYYSCEEPGCDFLLHQHCTNLPSVLDLGFQVTDEFTFRNRSTTGEISTLKLKADELSSLFACDIQWHLCNGFGFNSGRDLTGTTDLECSSAPKTIKHQLHHTKHIFYLISGRLEKQLPFACCSLNIYPFGSFYSYKCASCDFNIHPRCAFLPTKVSHKFDKHPLQLSSGTNVIGEYSCEICEGHVDTKYWFYHCKDCDQFFHVNCLPLVGLLSKIKFGGTCVIPCHRDDHPVTLTRMLEIGNQRCWKCKDIIEGFVDAMAFECSECCYWFHFHCALPEMARKLAQKPGIRVTFQ